MTTNTVKYKNDPTDNYEVIIEETPSDVFYNSEIDAPEHALIYIEHLEQKLKAKNVAIETLRKEMDNRENSYVVNRLWKIQYL